MCQPSPPASFPHRSLRVPVLSRSAQPKPASVLSAHLLTPSLRLPGPTAPPPDPLSRLRAPEPHSPARAHSPHAPCSSHTTELGEARTPRFSRDSRAAAQRSAFSVWRQICTRPERYCPTHRPRSRLLTSDSAFSGSGPSHHPYSSKLPSS